jgi:hypothetical protein
MTTASHNTIQAEPIALRRHHSSKLEAATQSWLVGIDWPNTNNLDAVKSNWSAHIKKIATEGSFLGFTKVVRLCRGVHAAINHDAASAKLSVGQKAALMRAVFSLGKMLANPRIETASSLQNLLQDLQVEFQLRDEEMNAVLLDEMESSAAELTTSESGEIEGVEHRDLEVYRSSRLDSLDQCIEEETWIVSQLASLAEDLASGTHSHHPASRLMHVLRGHKFFNQVDRVCLAGRVAHANQLVVVDASLSDRCPPNSLKKGYSCFVNPEGSLFKMKPGTVRVFSDCERVLDSFALNGKPAQRSIALISDQGLRSGLCLAIGRGDEIQGFLFLNSIQEDLFRHITVSSAPLLSLFGLVATIGLDTNGFHLASGSNTHFSGILPNVSTVFDALHFRTLVSESLTELMGGGKTISVEIKNDHGQKPFLYLPTTVIGTLAELVFRTGHMVSGGKLSLELLTMNNEVQIKFEHGNALGDEGRLKRIIQSVSVPLANKPIKILTSDTKIVLTFPFEPLLFGFNGLLYSTVF